jgi:hypothetical protein
MTLVCAAAVVLAAAGCGATKTVTRTVTVAGTGKTGAGPPGRRTEFGYIKSLRLRGKRYRMQFDPALLLTGITANVAAAQDGAVPPGEPVPNDNYVVNDSRRQLTYYVASDARVTVLKTGVSGTTITVAQLAALVAGENPFKRPLFEPLTTGFWILVNIDTVRALDQQYHP